MSEFRHFEMRQDGRELSGVAMRYGDIATLPFGRESVRAGAFGDVARADAILNVQHRRDRPLARTGGGGLMLSDSREALTLTANLPKTREADDALELVRTGILRGLSLEFARARANVLAGVRMIETARLLGFGLVDRPAYSDSLVIARAEFRQVGEDGLEGSFFYNQDTIISDRAAQVMAQGGFSRFPIPAIPETLETRQGESVRKRRIDPGAFAFALDDLTREISLVLGDYSRPLGSRLAGTLELEDTRESLNFLVERLPDTSYVRDFRSMQDTGAATFGVIPFYRIPPTGVVDNPTQIIPEPGNESVGIEVVSSAVLTALSVVYRPPRGNPGRVRRPRRRRRWL